MIFNIEFFVKIIFDETLLYIIIFDEID